MAEPTIDELLPSGELELLIAKYGKENLSIGPRVIRLSDCCLARDVMWHSGDNEFFPELARPKTPCRTHSLYKVGSVTCKDQNL